MHPLDWSLIIASLLIVLVMGLYTQTYMRSVADFLTAGRVARRYLLAVSRGEMATGAVVFVSMFQAFNHSGFALGWWGWLLGPLGLVVGLFGFIYYRYRETRVMTLAQFFEVRYSKRLRTFTGFLGFFAGILNFGIIPSVGARFMVYILDFPPQLHVLGFTIPTFIVLMAAFLSVNLFVTLTGGLITIMMTNCIEGIISQIMYLVLIAGLLSMFSWHQIDFCLVHQPTGQSFVNPMDTGKIQDFNIWYAAMGFLLGNYGGFTWQNRSAYNSAPLTAHEARMGGLYGGLRAMGVGAIGPVLAVCAYTYMHHPDFAAAAAHAKAQLAQIANPATRDQMTTPIALNTLLPGGLRGALCTVLLLGIFGGDSIALHSWGSLLIQDVILPNRKRPFTPEQHIRLLRLAITGVAVFGFLFGALVPPSDYVSMWFAVTQGIFTTGAGAVIIGGLYWKKGTSQGAWTAFIVGSVLSVTGIVAHQYYGPSFFLNGQQISFFCSVISVALYITVSLATCREDFNMDRMLHRGIYAKISEELGAPAPSPVKARLTWTRVIGIDQNFTRGDRWVAYVLFGWSMLFCGIMIVGTLWNLASPWSTETWSMFWYIVSIGVPVCLAGVMTIWFTWGGVSDSIDLFRRLRVERVNPLDNGMVVGHQNLDESILPEAVSPVAKPKVRSLSEHTG